MSELDSTHHGGQLLATQSREKSAWTSGDTLRKRDEMSSLYIRRIGEPPGGPVDGPVTLCQRLAFVLPDVSTSMTELPTHPGVSPHHHRG